MLKRLIIAIALIFSIQDSCAFTLRMACRAKGIELILCRELAAEWTKKTGVDVEIISLPHASNECFALYKQLLCSGQCDLDVVAMDIAWIGAFADKLENLCDYEGIEKDIIDDYFDAVKSTVMQGDRLIALSMYTDVGVLFYRKDLLKKYCCSVPSSFDELYETALRIQNAERESGNKHIHGYVFSAKAAEGLMCVANEVLYGFGGRFSENGKSSLESEAAIKTMSFMVKCAANICPVGIPNHNEEDSRGIFQIGDAVFMRNWPYAAVVNDCSHMKGKVGIANLPFGTLGGWNLAVPKRSNNKKLAADLVKHMTSKAAQKLRAVKGHYAPSYESLYCDSEVMENNPIFSSLKESLKKAVCRPSNDFGDNYQKASTIFVNFLNTAISDAKSCKDIKKELARVSKRLEKLLRKPNDKN